MERDNKNGFSRCENKLQDFTGHNACSNTYVQRTLSEPGTPSICAFNSPNDVSTLVRLAIYPQAIRDSALSVCIYTLCIYSAR